MMSGRDICGIAQTGTGKTIAYLLPCLRLWSFTKEKNPTILILVPTRELVVQVVEEVKRLTSYMSFRVVGVYGGVNMRPQADAVAEGCDMVVGTPGRLMDLVYQGTLKLKGIKKFILDEADEMLNLGFRPQIFQIMEVLPQKRQNLLFSATLSPDVESILDVYFNTPQRIEAAPAGTPLEGISQSYYKVPNFYTKVNLLESLLGFDKTMNKVLVFISTRRKADVLHELINERFQEQIGVIHSNKDQKTRFNSVRKFDDGSFRVLIATDIIARGIDLAGVSHVVNFDIPDEVEAYIHRIGRTGRADQKGIAISFVTEKEQPLFDAIQEYMKYEVPEVEIPEEVEISTELTNDEKPKGNLKEIYIKLPTFKEMSGAFHQKLEKNKKVNVKVRHSDKMMAKYGKPQKRKPRK